MKILDLDEISLSEGWDCSIQIGPRPYLRLQSANGDVYRVNLEKALSSVSDSETLLKATPDQWVDALRVISNTLRSTADKCDDLISLAPTR